MPSCHILASTMRHTQFMHWHVFQLLSQMLGGRNLEQHTQAANSDELWPAILTLSSYSLVSTNLYWALSNDASAWANTPDEAQEYLSNIFELNALRNNAICTEAQAIIGQLNALDITPMVLKNTGELLSQRSPHVAYRMQTDIDLLLKPEQLLKAYEALQQQGYCIAQEQLLNKTSTLTVAPAGNTAAIEREYAKHQHLPPLIKAGTNASVELHRHAYARQFQQHFGLNTLFDEADTQLHDGCRYLIMSTEQRRFHLVYHSYLNDGFKARHELPLRAACDYLQLPPNRDVNAEAQMIFFEQLIAAILHNQAPSNPAVKRHLRWLKRRYEHNAWAMLLDLNGKLRTGFINVIYNPQTLHKRWRLMRQQALAKGTQK